MYKRQQVNTLADYFFMRAGELLAETILDRIKEIEGIKKDKDLALALLSNSQNVSAWRKRNIIPWDRLIEYTRSRQVSFEWLVNGYGPPRRVDMISEQGAIYRVDTNQDALYCLAGETFKAVGELNAKLTAEKFTQLVRMAHRESLDRGESVPYAKIVELVKLAT